LDHGRANRVFHNLKTSEAQEIVDSIVEIKIPLIWKGDGVRRVLNPKLSLVDHLLVLLATSPAQKVNIHQPFEWTGYNNKGYFNHVLRQSNYPPHPCLMGSDFAMSALLKPGW